MSQTETAYAAALYDLAKETGDQGDILQQLQTLDAAFAQQPDYLRLLSTPGVPLQERLDILDAGFAGRVHPWLLNFLKILTEKGHIRHFAGCCSAYRDMYNTDNGILPVTAVTAVALTDVQTARLTEKMQQITGKQIQLRNVVDAACVGGIRLDYDGKQVDDTVSHRLQQMRSLLKNTVL